MTYDEQLHLLLEKINRKNQLKSMLDNLYAQQKELKEREGKLSRICQSEQADVDRLEGHGLAALFYAALGRREEKLSKEQAEAYAAAVKYETLVQELEAVERDINWRETEYTELQDCEAQYEKVLAEKLAVIRDSELPQAKEICRLEEKQAYLTSQLKEVREATDAGKVALKIVKEIESELDSAEGWGMVDLIGGGLISTMAKHGHMDEAQQKVEKLQAQLRCFRTELADVTIASDIQIEMGAFLRFADWFFDGLFADWAALDHIEKAGLQVSKTKGQINEVLNKLRELRNCIKEEQADLKEELDALVQNTSV